VYLLHFPVSKYVVGTSFILGHNKITYIMYCLCCFRLYVLVSNSAFVKILRFYSHYCMYV
jgi:hypothetical protein